LILRGCSCACAASRISKERLGITRPILANRLKKLVDEFVLVKVPYQQRPRRYEYRLTQKELDLFPMVCSGGEPLWPKQVRVHPRSGAKSLRHLALDTDLSSARRVAEQRAQVEAATLRAERWPPSWRGSPGER
jgi:hypothetical protein